MSAPPLGSRAEGPGAPKWRFAHFVQSTIATLLLVIYRVRVEGVKNLPAKGGYILAGNHVSYLDPALLWSCVPRPTHFMAKAEFWSSPLMGWGLSRLWAFPVRRGESDREAITRATTLLKAGEPVAIFPEGTRRRPGDEDETVSAHLGAAFIAMHAGVPVIPVGISGTEKALPAGARIPRFPQVRISFGKPVSPSRFKDGERKERMEAMTAEIMKRIGEERDKAGVV
ncbi:MAG: 1-acyl-sn-glycerol-3-phosphate acyltransferase [Coriobacteriia bacterium]|nr:1-acyl-sn-glycerol-3-phosphate acyltransferase [Coriobacteriia bacterium]